MTTKERHDDIWTYSLFRKPIADKTNNNLYLLVHLKDIEVPEQYSVHFRLRGEAVFQNFLSAMFFTSFVKKAF